VDLEAACESISKPPANGTRPSPDAATSPGQQQLPGND
jgi:hypothetical protein